VTSHWRRRRSFVVTVGRWTAWACCGGSAWLFRIGWCGGCTAWGGGARWLLGGSCCVGTSWIPYAAAAALCIAGADVVCVLGAVGG
jgi:hypothetical protein